MMDEDKGGMLCVHTAAMMLCGKLQGRDVGREAVAFLMGAHVGAASALSYSDPGCVGTVFALMKGAFESVLEAQGDELYEAWIDAWSAHERWVDAKIAEDEGEEGR